MANVYYFKVQTKYTRIEKRPESTLVSQLCRGHRTVLAKIIEFWTEDVNVFALC